MQQPTGLFFAHNPSILVSEVIKSFKDLMEVDLNQFMHDQVCILQHNCVEINHLYKGVHQIPKVLSKNQCLEIILNAEEYASQHGGWTTNRHSSYPTTDLPIEQVLGPLSSLEGIVAEAMVDHLVEVFHLKKDFLSVSEMFVAKYEYGPDKQASLKAHEDGTLFSFILTLNEPDVDFFGGGTRFLHHKGNAEGSGQQGSGG
eukprot:gene26873-35245_t